MRLRRHGNIVSLLQLSRLQQRFLYQPPPILLIQQRGINQSSSKTRFYTTISIPKMAEEQFKLIYTVEASHLEETKNAIFQAGAGQYEGGKYVQVAFQLTGEGQFLPVAEAGAAPHTGAVGQLEKVNEYRVEIFCQSRDVAKAAVAALKKAHPYEVPAYEVYKLENF